MPVSQTTQKWILTTAMLFNGLVTPGGMIYGWPGLSAQLKATNEYTSKCPSDWDPKGTATCSSQETALDNIFAVGANVATLSTIVYGFTLDRYGVRVNAFSGAALMCAGFILMAFSESNGFDAFIPGFALIAFGGLGTYLPAFQFAQLFERPTHILSIQSALFGAAGLTFTFLKMLYENHGISRKQSYLGYAGLVAFCAVNMLLLYPADSYQKGDTIHLPVLGWLGIQPPPPKRRRADSIQDVAETIENSIAHKQGDYSPPRAEDSMLSSDRARSASESLSSSGSLLSVNGQPGPERGTPRYGSDEITNSSPSPSGALDSESIRMSLLANGDSASDAVIPVKGGHTNGTGGYTKEELIQLEAESLVRDLTPLEFDAVKNSKTLKEEILNMGTLLVALHFSVGLLCSNMYNANISTLLKHMGDHNGNMANAFVFITSLYPCLFNLGVDTMLQKLRYAGVSFISTSLMIVSFGFLFIKNEFAQIPAFFFFATGRALLITIMFSFVAVRYRSDHYGRVIAFVTTLCAIIGLLQLLLQWILSGPANDNFDYFSGGFIAALVPLYYFSVWCKRHRV